MNAETAVRETPLSFRAGAETLSAVGVSEASRSRYDVISLHGAGTSTKARSLYLLKAIVSQTHLSAFSFDFSGHGESTGSREQSSLQKRTAEAVCALNEYSVKGPILVGSSMGAHVALKLLSQCDVRTLILFCPAVYPKDSFAAWFNGEFSSIIRRRESWKDIDILEPLKTFAGRLLIFMGREDKVVPPGVIELLDKNSPRVKKKKIVWIPHCPHGIHVFLSQHDNARKSVIAEVVDFIQDSSLL